MISVAIDGPSGAGKSSLAKRLAKDLGYVYVDTGALYRAVGYYMLTNGVPLKEAAQVEARLPEITLELKYADGTQRVILNGEDVSGKIRTPEVSMAASVVSAQPPVRRFLFDLQRDTAKKSDVIMDGRDIGTVVLPDARLKIFLTASPEARAKRRYAELCEKGEKVTYDAVLADMVKRDYDDTHRAAAPLKAADDAVLVDTTALSLEESIDTLRRLVEERL